MEINIALLRRFEGLRGIAYLAVACGIFSGPAAALVIIRPELFVSLALTKIIFIVGALGAPVLLVLTASFLASDVIGEPFKKLDLKKSVPGALVAGSVVSIFVHLFCLLLAGKDLHRYLWSVPVFTLCGVTGLLMAGIADRFGKKRRARFVGQKAAEVNKSESGLDVDIG
ncbi:hypothetical protein [Xanthomonas sacchari]|uniref:hypothetical protein n=1 Tax=Xanthomonas sacchari TaxID=56458 RepID=UPI00224CE419|nr:hypothetical protein [Xanthomonas sacchari]